MGRKLIIVDTEQDWLEQSSDLLLDYGYEVKTARGLEEGLKYIREEAPHLVLINRSRIKNLSELKRIVGSCGLRDSRLVVMVPGKLEISTLKKMLKAGAYDCITKPFDTRTLRETVEMALAAKKRLDCKDYESGSVGQNRGGER